MGVCTYKDDGTIEDRCALLRRIHPNWLIYDANRECVRITSAAFKDQELSVHVGADITEQGIDLETILQEKHGEYALASITAGLARDHKQVVCRDPQEDQLCHGLVCGAKKPKREFRGRRVATCKAFAEFATENWIVPPKESLATRLRLERS